MGVVTEVNPQSAERGRAPRAPKPDRPAKALHELPHAVHVQTPQNVDALKGRLLREARGGHARYCAMYFRTSRASNRLGGASAGFAPLNILIVAVSPGFTNRCSRAGA